MKPLNLLSRLCDFKQSWGGIGIVPSQNHLSHPNSGWLRWLITLINCFKTPAPPTAANKGARHTGNPANKWADDRVYKVEVAEPADRVEVVGGSSYLQADGRNGGVTAGYRMGPQNLDSWAGKDPGRGSGGVGARTSR